MPKANKNGGKKYKSNKKNFGLDSRNTVLKDSEQNYAIVTDVCGDCRFKCTLDDGTKALGILCGRLKKRRIWVNKDDLVLVSKRDYEQDKVDIINKYSHDELDYLRNVETCLEILLKPKNDNEDTEFYTGIEQMDLEYEEDQQDSDEDEDSELDIDDL